MERAVCKRKNILYKTCVYKKSVYISANQINLI